MWLALVSTVLILCISGAIYLGFAIARFTALQKIAGGRKWLARVISFGIVAVAFLIITIVLSVVDAAIVFIHVVFFFIVTGIAIKVIAAAREQGDKAAREQERAAKPKANLHGYIAIALSVIYLAVGYYQCMNVWETTYKLSSNKVFDPIRIALIADSHIGATFDGDGFAKLIDEIMSRKPDLLMIAGDFVDDDSKKADLIVACEALGRNRPKHGVWYVYGNHDKGYYQGRDFSAAELHEILQSNGINVLEDEVAYAGELCIIGRKDASTSRFRKSMDELVKDLDTSKYIVVLDHEPNDYENESRTEADLVLSGHTHGGQFIPLGFIQEIIKVNDGIYGHEIINGTDFIVTSGISNWALHFKTGTKSEYVIIDID